MKKRILSFALLMGAWASYSQVGIGTSSPSTSSQLDIVALDKGVLIPRIELRSTTEYEPVVGTPTESLLVYNTSTVSDVTPGFYYWQTDKWERIINQTQLTELLNDAMGDFANLQDLADYILPSNPDAPTTGGPSHTSVVYNPTTQEFSFITYENGAYVSTPINLADLIAEVETNTFVRKVEDDATGVVTYYYFSEEAITTWLAADTANTVDNMPNTGGLGIEVTGDIINNFEQILNQTTNYEGNPTTILEIIQQIASEAEGNVVYTNIGDTTNPDWVLQYWDGTEYQNISLNDLVASAESKTTVVRFENKHYYLSEEYIQSGGSTDPSTWASAPDDAIMIDVVGDVALNIQEILNTTVSITEGGNTFTTVEEYIQYISSLSEGNVVYTNTGDTTTPNWVFQYWDGTEYQSISINDMVAAAESPTNIERKGSTGTYAQITVEPTVNADVVYRYNAENGTNFINITADILESITNNEDIQNVITNILNTGGNVYYGDHDEDTDTPEVFYTIVGDVNTPIDVSDVVINAIINAETTQVEEIKNILGDTYSETTIVNTGDTWIDGGSIYKGIFEATIAQNTANVSAISLTAPSGMGMGDVIGIKILNAATNHLVNTSLTDISVNGSSLTFRIGTGNMYSVLEQAVNDDFDIKVIVEYSLTSQP